MQSESKALLDGNSYRKLEAPSRFDFTNPPIEPVDLTKQLAEEMLRNQGVGLSANQIGLPYQVFCVSGAGPNGEVLTFFNPKIVDVSKETILLDEGCLTFPGLSLKVRRPRTIKIRFTQPNGETKTEKFTGITARIIQHEMDHMEGSTFIEKASIIQKEKAKKWLKKMEKVNG